MTSPADLMRQWLDVNINGGADAQGALMALGVTPDALPGEPEDRGQFYVYSKATPQKLRKAEDADLNGHYLMFTGIDTNGKKYISNFAGNIADFLNNGAEPIAAYHYDTPAIDRVETMRTLIKDEGYYSEESMRVAKKLFAGRFNKEQPDKLPERTVVFTHSFGAFFQKMVLNALSQLALDAYDQDRDKARKFMSRFTTINFGVKPPWREEHTEGGSKYLDIQKNGIELYVVAPDDILPHTPRFALKAYDELWKNSGGEALLFRHEGDARHKLMALLPPGNIPAAIDRSDSHKQLPNLGGHNLPHYLHALVSAPALESLRTTVRLAIEDPNVFEDHIRLNSTTRVIKHADHAFDPPKELLDNMVDSWVKQIGRERPSYNGSGKHPFDKF